MSEADKFTDAQREHVRAEINRHAMAAYERGLAEGRRQAGPVVVAAWLKSACGSWTMRAGVSALALGVAGDVWPVAAELLAGRIDPQLLALIGGAFMALRARTVGK